MIPTKPLRLGCNISLMRFAARGRRAECEAGFCLLFAGLVRNHLSILRVGLRLVGDVSGMEGVVSPLWWLFLLDGNSVGGSGWD